MIAHQLCNRNGEFAKRGKMAREEYPQRMYREVEMCRIERFWLAIQHGP